MTRPPITAIRVENSSTAVISRCSIRASRRATNQLAALSRVRTTSRGTKKRLRHCRVATIGLARNQAQREPEQVCRHQEDVSPPARATIPSAVPTRLRPVPRTSSAPGMCRPVLYSGQKKPRDDGSTKAEQHLVGVPPDGVANSGQSEPAVELPKANPAWPGTKTGLRAGRKAETRDGTGDNLLFFTAIQDLVHDDDLIEHLKSQL